jgi:hypothetical protein
MHATILRPPLRRPTRRDRAVSTVQDLTSPRALAVAGAALATAIALAVATRRRLWHAIGFAARAVEEVADTVEDAAEDLDAVARERTRRE